jgi:hypothetical protein
MMTDVPDYSRYTELQLRQVLCDTNVQRFPERVEQARQRLAYFELAKKAVMPQDGQQILISKAPSRRQIKWHLIITMGASLVAALLTLIYPERWTDLAGITVVFVVGALYGKAHMEAFQLQVFDCGSGLGFKYDEQEAYATWQDVDRIELSRSDGDDWLVVHLKFESVMGDAIEFYAAKDGLDARALRDLLNHTLKKGMV